jgi:hypothetical protein
MLAKPLMLKFWQRQVVVVVEDINKEDMLSVQMSEILEKPPYLLASKVSHCSHRI